MSNLGEIQKKSLWKAFCQFIPSRGYKIGSNMFEISITDKRLSKKRFIISDQLGNIHKKKDKATKN